MRRLVSAARVARLATVRADGQPHLVPVCFALVGETAYTAVDAKPKRSGALQRVTNVRATGVASLLIDEYAEDWTQLWWVRADGQARIADSDERESAVAALVLKYEQYARDPPPGDVIAIDIQRWTGWSARG